MALVKRVSSGGKWEGLFGYSQAVAVGPLVMTSACAAAVDGRPSMIDDPGAQAKEAFRSALDALVRAGAGIGDVVRSRMYIVNPEHAEAVGLAHGELFGVVRPTATVVVVNCLTHPEQLVAVELEAFRGWRE
ncbi:Rid family hydrolase [Natronoglycomyces albus]|uniref:RidA family protein n=1 Tax=Natronoglycomyces albus TaxID=2811108 RepID=A0A895XH45_9ACTN|nr:Rid family hydrolase [Natronoglycomyces albus]QSB04237.1 RidA family protein [Natronoglycomyces albus]